MALTDTGLTVPTTQDIVTDLEDAFKSAFGTSIDLHASSPFGQIIGIMADRFATLYELIESIYNAGDEGAATGAALELICALTGTYREPAASSSVTLTLTGTDTTVVPAGKQASVTTTEEIFVTSESGTITQVDAWAATTAYAVGDRVYNDSPANVYECTVAGTSAGSGGPTGETTGITDNTVTWNYLGDGDSAVDVDALSQNTGPIVAVARGITTIDTPVSGWQSVINTLDATLGSDEETDAELRVRRRTEITGGSRHIESIREAVLDVDNVTSCKVFENTTGATDGDGVPSKAIEVLVEGGATADIAAAIFEKVPEGIETYGSSSDTITDSQSISHTVYFSRPTTTNIYIDIELTYDATLYPTDGDDQIKAKIVEYGDTSVAGLDVVSSRVKRWCFDIPGVLDVTLAEIGTSDPPTAETTIAIGTRALAVYDTSRITVVSTPGTP